LHHVSVPRPPGSGDQARAFYSRVLGLSEIPLPAAFAGRDIIWFRLDAETELHTFAEEPLDDSSRRHLCLAVDDLEALRQKLEAEGYEVWDAIAIAGRPRFYCRDPFGNQIELTSIEHDYR
jgi:catechol 2,3-dioxygenase-like lactoylglutathione lyase family enzyme